jgi:hypothetical protein
MIAAALALTVAIVVPDQTALRADARDDAPRQATLTSGDWLEVRGERNGYVQVYDHRRERSGYVRPATVRRYELDEATAPKLSAIVEFLEDAPGQESLGIGYVALALRAAPPQAVGADLFDALGTMAERLAARASARVARSDGNGNANTAAQIEAAESYGVHFVRFEEDEGHTRVCYDGEAFRRVLAARVASMSARVHAALSATDPRCTDPTLGPSAALALAKEQATILDAIDPSALGGDAPSTASARLRVRRAVVQASVAYFAARTDDGALAKQAAESAKRELLLADRSTLSAEDRPAYDEAALRVSAVRWASETPTTAQGSAFDVTLAAGEPGQTCVRVKRRADPPAAPGFAHCTYAIVWPASIRVAPHDAAITMVTQPLAGWSELLVLRPTDSGFSAETLTPMTTDPELGYVELAGFAPDGAHLLVVREARATGPLGSPNTATPSFHRSFDLVTTGALRVEKHASSLAAFPTFRRWASAGWQSATLALR